MITYIELFTLEVLNPEEVIEKWEEGGEFQSYEEGGITHGYTSDLNQWIDSLVDEIRIIFRNKDLKLQTLCIRRV